MDTPPSDKPKPMSAIELAQAAGVHPNTVRADIESQTIHAERVGGIWIIDGEEAARYIAARSLVAQGEAALQGLRDRMRRNTK